MEILPISDNFFFTSFTINSSQAVKSMNLVKSIQGTAHVIFIREIFVKVEIKLLAVFKITVFISYPT